ncbi:SUKH-4 family immunity protein [Streptomyces sp. NPDC059575]|uniref:SUKH-4 family immunity protein n=1 Tax=Streptomyces sp. NPDC059575 TaxID=3346872 RepID=UPI0036ACA568
MERLVTPMAMIAAYGLTNVTYYPPAATEGTVDPRAMNLLSSVGLPHSKVFVSREDPQDPNVFPCGAWWPLGYLFTSLIALDPRSGNVYALAESEDRYEILHRDLESLLFALIQFRKLEIDHDNGVDPEELSERFRQVVGAFDPTPFADEESQWNLSLEELEHGIW